jgi:hypothetical protein
MSARNAAAGVGSDGDGGEPVNAKRIRKLLLYQQYITFCIEQELGAPKDIPDTPSRDKLRKLAAKCWRVPTGCLNKRYCPLTERNNEL